MLTRADTSLPLLVVNADDFGFFAQVTQGILHCIDSGVVTAVGLMANGPAFSLAVDALRTRDHVDCGIHLNLSYGRPLTRAMSDQLCTSDRRFPGKFAALWRVQAGALPSAVIEAEWRAQIERCIDAGIELRFMNSHEHVHMLPRLWRLAARLATDYDIPLIRRTGPEWTEPWQPSSVLRNAALALMAIGSEPGRTRLPVLRGVSCSGRLDVPYLRDMLRRAEPGAAYELMCHPGFPDPEALSDPSLAGYHRWQQEVDVLCSSTFRDLLRDFRIRLIRFRDLSGTGP